MQNLKELLTEVSKLNYQIKTIIKASNFDDYDDLSGLNINYEDPDDLFLQDELRGVLYKLDDVQRNIEYLSKPVTSTETLHKNSRERYECKSREFSSGCGIECLIYDDFEERYKWVSTRVEHDGKDYYLVGCKDISLEGLRVRFRK